MALLNATVPEVLEARYDFELAQRRLGGDEGVALSGFFACGWYGTAIQEDRGCFAIANTDGPFAPYVGQRLELTRSRRSVIVFCFAQTDLPHDIALARRPYMALESPAIDEIFVTAAVLGVSDRRLGE